MTDVLLMSSLKDRSVRASKQHMYLQIILFFD